LNFVITRNDRVAWMREMLTAYKNGWAEGQTTTMAAVADFYASLRKDRVMKIGESSGDYSNETFNKIPANQLP